MHEIAPLMKPPPKLPVLGTGISATNYGEIVRLCRCWVEQRREWLSAGAPLPDRPAGRGIFLCNVHSVMTGVLQPEFRKVLQGADIATSDGMPLVWALRSLGVRGQPRVYGPDLMLEVCEQAAAHRHRIFLYGGGERTLPALCKRLTERFPGLLISGAHGPPFRPLTREEDAACIKEILDSNADIVFVGIGMPKQERWIAEHRDRLPGVVMLGVGAAFDFHAGRVRQAPGWMQRVGLEWLFRLLMEPCRLWKRYLLLNPLFLAMWGLQLAGVLRYKSAASAMGFRPGMP